MPKTPPRPSPPRLPARVKPHTPLPPPLRAFWLTSAAAFALSLLTAALKSHSGIPRNGWHPLPDPPFTDLLEYLPTFRLLHTAAFFHSPLYPPVAYPPFAAILFRILYATGHPLAVYMATALLGLAAALYAIRRALIAHGLRSLTATLFPLTLTLFSFPILGLLQRANIELFLWIFAAAGVWAYLHRRNDAAALLWSLAAATKLYPILFLILLLPRRKYRAFALGIASFTLVSLLSMLYLGPTLSIAFHGALQNIFGYQGFRVAQFTLHELAANHSLFGLVKLAAALCGHPPAALTLPYYLAAGALMALLFLTRLRSMPETNQLLAVTVFMVLLPPVSYFYTLVHLYAPCLILIFLALRAGKTGESISGLTRTLLVFVPLLVPYTLFTFRTLFLFGGLVEALFLVTLFLCALLFPFPLRMPSQLEAGKILSSPNCRKSLKRKEMFLPFSYAGLVILNTA